jgi:hypothetical protein
VHYSRVGSGRTGKHQTRLERLARDKHSCLLRTFVKYGRKKFDNIRPGWQYLIHFFIVTDAAGKYARVFVSSIKVSPMFPGKDLRGQTLD